MPTPKPHLRFLVTKEGAMILDIPADELTTLNESGGYVWAQLKEGKSVEEIIDDISESTSHDRAVVAADVREFVDQLTVRRLVTM